MASFAIPDDSFDYLSGIVYRSQRIHLTWTDVSPPHLDSAEPMNSL